jgi:hypothetical protein
MKSIIPVPTALNGLARRLMDFVCESMPSDLTEQDCAEVQAYHNADLCLDFDIDKCPHVRKLEKSYKSFIASVEDKFPELAEADLDFVIGGTWKCYWICEGFPMQTELRAIEGRLEAEIDKINK